MGDPVAQAANPVEAAVGIATRMVWRREVGKRLANERGLVRGPDGAIPAAKEPRPEPKIESRHHATGNDWLVRILDFILDRGDFVLLAREQGDIVIPVGTASVR